jgi:hypothetical protein
VTGNGMSGRRFFDCHTHLFPEKRLGGLMRWIRRAVPDYAVPEDITADEAVRDLRSAGAVRWANLLFPIAAGEAAQLHVWGAELAERVPEITPFGGVHVDDDDPLGVVQEAIELHAMAGLKFHPMVQRFDPWDVRLAPVLAYLDVRELPIYVHTGYDAWYGHHMDRAALEKMVGAHRGLPVVLPHLGFPDVGWAFALADRHPNVWLDLTNVPGSFPWLGLDEDDELLEAFRSGVSRHRDRSLMGTDYPAGMGSLEQIIEQFEQIGFEPGLLEYVMTASTAAYFDRYGRPRP